MMWLEVLLRVCLDGKHLFFSLGPNRGFWNFTVGYLIIFFIWSWIWEILSIVLLVSFAIAGKHVWVSVFRGCFKAERRLSFFFTE